MEKFNPTNEEGEGTEKKPSAIGGIVKKTLAVGAAAAVAFSGVKMHEGSKEAEKFAQENPKESLEQFRNDVQDISLIESNPNIPKNTKFYFRSNIHNDDGIKWVGLIASDNHDFNAVTAKPGIIKFIEENPAEKNAFLRKNEKGGMELVKENGEVVMTIE